MSAADATLAARSRRHRERAAAERGDVLEAIGAMRKDLAALAAAVESLAGALRNGGGSTVDANTGRGGKPARKSQNSQTSVAQREPARARGVTPPPLTGVVVASTVRDDAWRVARILTAPASAGAIRDAMSVSGPGWPLERITTALVFLQGQGQVTRSPGEGGRPDRWLPVREDDPPRIRPRPPVDAVTVECSSYAAHTAHHRWDPDLGRFRCVECEPSPMAPGPPVPPPAVQGPPRRQDVPAPVAPGGP